MNGRLTAAVGFFVLSLSLRAMTIQLNPTPDLASNPDALAAVQRAADAWAGFFSNPITIDINVDMRSMGAWRGLASTTIYYNTYSYDSVRDRLVGDGATHVDKTVLLSLPTLDQFTTDLYLPSGWSYNGNIRVPAADSKALGLSGFGGADASIAFNTSFSYYYGNAGLPATEYDLQTAAMHEIGHVLGFSSSVDWVDNLYDYTGLGMAIYPLDLYHFRTADLSLAGSDFANTPRSIEPGVAASIWDALPHTQWRPGFLTGMVLRPVTGNGRFTRGRRSA